MPRRHQGSGHHGAGTSETTTTSSKATTTSTSTQQLSSHTVKKRIPLSSGQGKTADSSEMEETTPDESRPLLSQHHHPREDASNEDDDGSSLDRRSWIGRNQWIVFALASGACAAFNGVFAKLTTTELTTSFSKSIAHLLHLSDLENAIEIIVRSMFFGLNLVFNGVMWTLFTTALTRGNSTTQVSIINTSSNFVITAILGLAIFSESLPPLWWLGAAMLVAGNVIIGRKDEGSSGTKTDDEDESLLPSSSPESDAGDGRGGTFHRIPGVEEPVFIPREEKDDDENDALDLEVEGNQ